MNRRTYLAAFAGIAAGTAGCLSSGSGVSGTSVEHVEPRRNREQRPTIVSFDEAAGTVSVLGFMAYGSSSCNRVGIDSTTYDEDYSDYELSQRLPEVAHSIVDQLQ